MPDFTVIVATLNAERHIANCLRSIRNQRGVEVELIVVDGGSVDGTREIAQAYASKTVTAPKLGIYPAFNQGIQHAQGAWVFFLGADDLLMGDYSLALVKAYISQRNAKIFYAQCVLASLRGGAKLLGRPWSEANLNFKLRQCLPHGSTFYQRQLLQRYPFDEQWQIAGDYDQLARIFEKEKPAFIPFPIVRAATGGVSTHWRSLLRSLREVRLISVRNFPEAKRRPLWFDVLKGIIWRVYVSFGLR